MFCLQNSVIGLNYHLRKMIEITFDSLLFIKISKLNFMTFLKVKILMIFILFTTAQIWANESKSKTQMEQNTPKTESIKNEDHNSQQKEKSESNDMQSHKDKSVSDNKLSQRVIGTVIDFASKEPLPYVTVAISSTKFTITNDKGEFIFNNIPIGRYDIQASLLGYKAIIINNIMVTSAKETVLEISLTQRAFEINDIVVKPQIKKEVALNNMALSGNRVLSTEEARYFAGAMDDPARLVSSYAGIAPAVGNNGISIHGNAPSLLQWRLEGIEIPNPNHFADIVSLGGGIVSSLSGNVLADSDFFTGAFPAEYSNALSGVFDMRLKTGNNRKHQHTAQIGVMGIDFSSEGPFSKKESAKSSYIFNYRYSTIALMNKINPGGGMDQVLDYQDLNFKFNFPTKRAGIFSIWGTGLANKIDPEMKDPKDWEYYDDSKASGMKQRSAAVGISHRIFLDREGLLKTTLATTHSFTHAWEDSMIPIDDNYNQNSNKTTLLPYLNLENRYNTIVLTSSLNKKFGKRHVNRTGITFTNLSYDMDLDMVNYFSGPLNKIYNGKGNTNLVSVYTSSLFNISRSIAATLGVNAQFFELNKKNSLEPRASIKWQISPSHSTSMAYGLHSRIEKMDVYYVKKEGSDELVNKNLDFTKSHHLSFCYNYKITKNLNLKIEPYFQTLFNVPVIADSSYSIINRTEFYVKDELVNKGKGQNYGVDITLEKYMTKGLYYMVNGSIFNSKFCGGDGVWHNTRFNRKFITNILVGKEWMIGRLKQNQIGINTKITYMGGDRYSPINQEYTIMNPDKKTEYDHSSAYSEQFSPIFLLNFTLSYRINKGRVSHEFAIKRVNANGYKEYFGHEYNIIKEKIEPRRLKNSAFNVSYRIEF